MEEIRPAPSSRKQDEMIRRYCREVEAEIDQLIEELQSRVQIGEGR